LRCILLAVLLTQMSFLDLALQLAAAALALLFWLSVRSVGAALIRGWRGLEERWAAEAAVGLTTYVLLGLVLGAAHAFRWPVLAAAAVLPGLGRLVVAVLAVATGRGPWATAVGSRAAGTLLTVSLGIVLTLHAIAATGPPVTYDLLVNYLAVPTEYLLQGHLGALDHNVFSSLSLPLHILVAYTLALGEPIRTTPFAFGFAPVFGMLLLGSVLGACWCAARLASRLLPRSDEGPDAARLAALLWLTMPQTLLIMAMGFPDLLLTGIAMILAVVVVVSPRDDRGMAIAGGLLAGLLVASKAQMAPYAGMAVLILLARSRPATWPRVLVSAGLLPTVTMVRNALAFGSPLFPHLPGGGPAAAAARRLAAENVLDLTPSPVDAAHHLWRFLTLQPETGITFLALLALLPGRIRDPRIWGLAIIPVVALNAVSGSTYNVLRWTQPAIVLLLLLASANLARLVSGSRITALAVIAALACSAVLAVGFTDRLVGFTDRLTSPAMVRASRQVPDIELRARLVQLEGRVLYVGVLHGTYGAANGLIATILDGRVLARWLGADSADEMMARLRADGFRWLAVSRAFDGKMRAAGYWDWQTPEQARQLHYLLTTLPVLDREGGTTVYGLPGD
jgi:hypothetical protein